MRAITVDPAFHSGKKWVFPAMWNLIETVKSSFGCEIIASQADYDRMKKDLEWVFVNQPGWSAPKISFDKSQKHKLAMILSDPHDKVNWLPQYVIDNDVNYLLCVYWEACLKFLPTISREKFIFFPWSIPDELCPIQVRQPEINNKLMIFGSMDHQAYAMRRWCCNFPFVEKHDRSLQYIHKIPYSEYMSWLGRFGAIVCAGSREYPFVFPKTYEVAAAGSLVFVQDVKDLQLLGFDESNCVKFNEGNFESLAKKYISNPSGFDEIRKNGQKLIRSRHLVSHRIRQIGDLLS